MSGSYVIARRFVRGLTIVPGAEGEGPAQLQGPAIDAAGNVDATPAVHTWKVKPKRKP